MDGVKKRKYFLPARCLLAFLESKLDMLSLVEVGRRDDLPLVIVDSVELNLPAIRNAEAINKSINQEIKNSCKL